MILKLGSWYSGAIDGFAYAAKQLNIETIYHIESDRRAYKYLRENYPGVPIHRYDNQKSIKDLPWAQIIAGGDPCQPNSTNGKRLGTEDPRYRWPFMFEGIRLHKPDWVINENVTGSISNMVLDQKISDLESIGYTCQAISIGAVALNADHQRQRIFLIANSNAWGRDSSLRHNLPHIRKKSFQATPLDTQGNSFLRFEKSICEPAVFPMANGIPDQVFRLGATGNSIVPQVPMIFLELIKDLYNQLFQ